MTSLRSIPSIDTLLGRPALARAIATHGHESVTGAARQAADALRDEIRQLGGHGPGSDEEAAAWLERRALDILRARVAPSLRRVINATGVIIHTNLGRAPLAAEAIERAGRIAGGYSNLEYDLEAGDRGHRHVHAERLLRELTGAEAALVVNNNAAATLVVLAALADGREVIVSRGELVEIGGGFRIPEVLAESGAVMREVGTTNRTRVTDYAAAIGERTALLLRVHPSNFRIEGFTERPGLAELTALAHRFKLPVFEDLGSGWLGAEDPDGSLRDEPSVTSSLRAGADLVAFSGDKLLGGPQAGIVTGRRDLIDQVRRHPLMRAVRADKLTYAAVESTLGLWADAPSRLRIPVVRMLTMSVSEIETRAKRLIEQLNDIRSLTAEVVDGASTTGGGSAPGSALPTKLVALAVEGVSAASLEARLRAGDPPVIARIRDGRVVLDLRTVADGDGPELATSVRRAAQS